MKDPTMLKRLNEIEEVNMENKTHILHMWKGFIKSVKFINILLCKKRKLSCSPSLVVILTFLQLISFHLQLN